MEETGIEQRTDWAVRMPRLHLRGYGVNLIPIYTLEERTEFARRNPGVFIDHVPSHADIHVHQIWRDIQAKKKKK